MKQAPPFLHLFLASNLEDNVHKQWGENHESLLYNTKVENDETEFNTCTLAIEKTRDARI